MRMQGQTGLERGDYRLLAVSAVLLVVWNVVSWRFPFFWDSVSHSRIATWYLESGFAQLTIPEGLDAGHPPFFNLYLAVVWKLFGRSLMVAHLAMFPLLAIVLVQYHRLLRRWLAPKARIWAMLLLFCEPTFLTQAGMVTADIAMVTFYLLALNALLDGRRGWAAVAMILMAAMSFRGILMVGALFFTDMAVAWAGGKRRADWRRIWPYLPVVLLTMLWLWLHHAAVGWWISTPEDTYAGQRQVLGVTGMARNVALIGWRVADFGRVFLWLFALVGILGVGWRRFWGNAGDRSLIVVLAVPLVMLSVLLIPFSNPIGHRYYLVCYLLLIILAVRLADLDGWTLKYKVGLAVVALGMATGHFWIYPRGIAQGWDGSLAHMPIFQLEKGAHAYLAGQGIAPDQVCTDFPLLHPPYDTWLEGEEGKPWTKNFLEEPHCDWVLVSNTNNGYTEGQWREFEDPTKWELKEEFRSMQLFIRIYRRH